MYGPRRGRRRSLLQSKLMLRNLVIKMDASEPENNLAGLPCAGLSPKSARLSPSSPSSPSPKRSRRSIQKRVVSIPIQEAAAGDGSRAKGVSECAPRSDSWAWRKYGQKPIKGSPYPRGYYRCSSSKGCPARKQVERSSVDPTMLVVTYTCEHNHPWPTPKNQNSGSSSKQQHMAAAAAKEEGEEVGPEAESDPDPDPTTRSPPDSGADPEGSRFSDLICEDSTAAMMTMIPDDFWYSDVGSTSSTSPPSDTLLYGPIFVAADEFCEKVGDFKDDVEDALFAGLGELPEYSTVFRRSYFDRRLQQPMAVHTAVHQ